MTAERMPEAEQYGWLIVDFLIEHADEHYEDEELRRFVGLNQTQYEMGLTFITSENLIVRQKTEQAVDPHHLIH